MELNTFSIAARWVTGVRNRTTIGCPIPTVVPSFGVTVKATRTVEEYKTEVAP